MLRVKTQKTILSILNTLEIIVSKSSENLKNKWSMALEESKNAIEIIEKKFEEEKVEDKEFLEILFELKKSLDSMDEEEILCLINKSKSIINNIRGVYEIVFFPYKAEMWDSLESIWLACCKDKRCDCKVVPIPYYSYNAKEDEWIWHYEIDNFPNYIPVISYREYSLERKPDAAFIHNPYDEYNRVTHVQSDYYSYNLKPFINKLFYVPYYANIGVLSYAQRVLSAYPNVDYIVCQSREFKEGFKEYNYYSKAIVMGSPKFDRVIKMTEKKDEISVEWKEQLDGKKTIMLNTSLACFLYDSEAYLRKLRYIFERIEERRDVTIIWRPHPLLYSTIQSMRPHLMKDYKELQSYFIYNKIGILDNTSDVTKTVAIADAYVGENWSSIKNLFCVANKPLFLLNNYIYEKSFPGKKVLVSDAIFFRDEWYLLLRECNGLYKLKDGKWQEIIIVDSYRKVAQWQTTYGKMLEYREQLYMMPVISREIIKYDGKMRMLWENPSKIALTFADMFVYKNKIFFIPKDTGAICKYDILQNNITNYNEPIDKLKKGVINEISEDVYACRVVGSVLWGTTRYSNRILRFDMDSEDYQIYSVGESEISYTAIEAVGEILYLGEAKSGNIVAWDIRDNKIIHRYRMPERYISIPDVTGCYCSHGKMIYIKNCLLISPKMGSGLAKIDLKTGKVSLVAEDFWKEAFLSQNGYQVNVHGVSGFMKVKDEETLWIQRICDGAMLELNVESENYNIFYPQMEQSTFNNIIKENDGFEKMSYYGEFACRESELFSFDDFLDGLINERYEDVLRRQKKEVETIAVNLDGSCGEKTKEFMLQALSEN